MPRTMHTSSCAGHWCCSDSCCPHLVERSAKRLTVEAKMIHHSVWTQNMKLNKNLIINEGKIGIPYTCHPVCKWDSRYLKHTQPHKRKRKKKLETWLAIDSGSCGHLGWGGGKKPHILRDDTSLSLLVLPFTGNCNMSCVKKQEYKTF